MLVRSKAGKARGVVTDLEAGHVMVWLPNSKGFEQNVSLGLDGFCWPVDFVHIGLPHAVTYVESLETFPVSRWGPLIRHHERFQPRGVNVNFVEVREPGKIAIRTYEFGVEAETLACGTGSCCSAVASAIRFGWPEDFFCGNKPVEVKVLAGSTIRVRFVSSNQREIANVRFETRVVPVYDGVIRPELLNEFSFLR
jgi:diaminopimelate epimerase